MQTTPNFIQYYNESWGETWEDAEFLCEANLQHKTNIDLYHLLAMEAIEDALEDHDWEKGNKIVLMSDGEPLARYIIDSLEPLEISECPWED